MGNDVQLDFKLAGPAQQPASAPAAPRIYGVGELTREIRVLLEARIGEIWVRGEVSNYRRQSSGHHYFTLKDESAQLTCVLFAGDARFLKGVALEDGLEIQAWGGVSVYEARGQYQLIVRKVRLRGEGELRARFEALKRRLRDEGLFDPVRKQTLPRFPRRVGVITSPSGAALRDFLHVLRRRSPSMGVLLHPVRVQGTGAAAEIVRALEDFNRMAEAGLPEVDLVVITRGGGSIEDLWEFNEESLARAIAASRVPVVSAVGHEIDFTIADFVADLRAPTPSAAAEVISADSAEVLQAIAASERRMLGLCAAALREASGRFAGIVRSAAMREPLRRLREAGQEMDRNLETLTNRVASAMTERKAALARAAGILAARHPRAFIAAWRQQARAQLGRFRLIADGRLQSERRRIERLASLLEAYNPEHTLRRGFTLTMDAKGAILRSAAAAAGEKEWTTRFVDGSVKARPMEPS